MRAVALFGFEGRAYPSARADPSGSASEIGGRMSQPPEGQMRVEDYVKGELSKDTNWWGAFVVGLAGVILVTGIAGPAIVNLGSAAIPNFVFWAAAGWLLCIFVAELAAILPDRTGGAPAY